MRRKRPIKKGTLKYFESAIEFFKQKFGVDNVDCQFLYKQLRDSSTLSRYFREPLIRGSYDMKTKTIRVYACDWRPRNELVKTLFHELVHYWQHCIAKKLHYRYFARNDGFCQDHSEKSLIQDWYHTYLPKPVLYYEDIETDLINYWDKPEEIEARKMAEELFSEWNMPEWKGKTKF